MDAVTAAAAELRADFSHNVRMTRLSLGITQRQLATVTGITQKHISTIELEGANVGLDFIGALARALGVQPSDLLEPRRPKPSVW